MRKQTKLVAVLSAAALLAVGASMTSFAAGWTEENGTWVYYDGDEELVTNEWKKSGSNYYYLNDDGEMATETWVEDEYYVDETGKMVTNSWQKLILEDAEIDDPDGDGEGWFFFDSKGKKVTDTKKTINGKVYYFDGDGVMETGWYQDDANSAVYYLGDEDDGARKSGWLWLERPEEDDIDFESDDCELCEDEGWYWFAKDGKMYAGNDEKRIDGKYFYFNEHGQMLYNWILATDANGIAGVNKHEPDDEDMVNVGTYDITDMEYAFNVDKGWRTDGWLLLDGSYAVGKENDEDWYWFKKGDAKYAPTSVEIAGVDTPLDLQNVLLDRGNSALLSDSRYRARIKVEGKYFCFDNKGAMKTGLQAITTNGTDYETYFFDDKGFMKTGKVSGVEMDNGEIGTFYFTTSNMNKGRGVTGAKDGYLYYKGLRMEAEDDYEIYAFDVSVTVAGSTTPTTQTDYYLVNKSGKIQKSTAGKKIDAGKIENNDWADTEIHTSTKDNDYVYVTTDSKGIIKTVGLTKADKSLYEKGTSTNSLTFATPAQDNALLGWETN